MEKKWTKDEKGRKRVKKCGKSLKKKGKKGKIVEK